MNKKKKYIRPELEIEYSYDLESELMYTPIGGGGSTLIIGSNPGSGGGSDDDDGDSDRAKGGSFIWDDFEFNM